MYLKSGEHHFESITGYLLAYSGHMSCGKVVVLYDHTPSRDKASRMLLQAVARSEMDCHSSSDESAVSERTERQKKPFNNSNICANTLQPSEHTS